MRSEYITIHIHHGDLPSNLSFEGDIAIDTETTGLNLSRDRLCVIQLSAGDGDAHLVQFSKGEYNATNLRKVLTNKNITKIFHFARFDVAAIYKYLNVQIENIYCTKIASKIARTYTDTHGLKDLCRDLLDLAISKQQQSSYWGHGKLSKEQVDYAATDVLHLHKLRDILNTMLAKEGRAELAEQCFSFINLRVKLDLAVWNDVDIFAHK